MLDRFNRDIYYLRISITDRCNLRCKYCMPEQGIKLKSHEEILTYEQIIKIVKAAAELGFKKIRITGGEPLVRRGVEKLVKEIKSISGIEEVTLTTNGVLLKYMAKKLKDSGLDRINISLDTLNPNKYKEITRIGDIRFVLEGIDETIRVGFKNTKINMVIIPNFNDNEVEDMKNFCDSKGLFLQRINHYSLNNINSINKKYKAERPLPCSKCNRIRLTSDGYLKPCLFSNLMIKIDFNDIKSSIIKAIQEKPAAGTFNTTTYNYQIGG